MARFQPGTSGNPEGARMHKANKLREALATAAPDVITKLIARAKAGDPVALRLFLERVLPALKPEAKRVEFTLPGGTLMERAEFVLALVAAGELPMDLASEYVTNATKLVAVTQGTELRAKLELLLAERFGDIA